MCHLILSLPIIGIPVFWILPLQFALPVYIVILIISVIIYYAIMMSMKTRVRTGKKGLVGEIGNIFNLTPIDLLVHVHGEIWEAISNDKLKNGDKIRIIKVEGLRLNVRKIN
jgi:inner membrane protein